MPTPAVRASTSTRARPQEVYDKMTTVRGVSNYSGNELKKAIAEVVASTEEGTKLMEHLKARLVATEKAQRSKKR